MYCIIYVYIVRDLRVRQGQNWDRTPCHITTQGQSGGGRQFHHIHKQCHLPSCNKNPNQAIQNKPMFLDQIRVCVCVYVTVLTCSLLLWCMGRCLCAGLFVFVQGLFLVFRPHPPKCSRPVPAAQWTTSRATLCHWCKPRRPSLPQAFSCAETSQLYKPQLPYLILIL